MVKHLSFTNVKTKMHIVWKDKQRYSHKQSYLL